MENEIHHQATTNSNNTVQSHTDEEVSILLQRFVIATVEGIVETQLNSSLWYRVQCVGCEKAGELLSMEPGTVRNWIKTGRIPASKIGKDWSIRLADIDRMLKNNATAIPISDRRFSRKIKSKIS